MSYHNEPVLIISYDWPPMVAGVRRMVKFARYLPDFGYRPIVVAARPTCFGPHDDRPLREEVGNVPVHYAAAYDPYHAAQWLRSWRRRGTDAPPATAKPPKKGSPQRKGCAATTLKRCARNAANLLLMPDDRVGWVGSATRTAARLIREHGIRRIITTSYPHSAHLVGLRIKQLFPEMFWLADFRDGWVQNPYFAHAPTPWHRRRHRELEARVVQTANAVTTVCEPIARHLATATDGHPEKVHIIANGFDPNDLTGMPPPEPFDRFTMVYTGTLFMHRSPDVFFAALRRVSQELFATEAADKVQVIFMSRFQPEHYEAVARHGLSDIIKVVPMGSHRDALHLQLRADALLALEGEAAHSEIMLTQKIFEYMAARRPVLALTPEGALADAVRQSGCGMALPPTDRAGVEQALRNLLRRDGTFAFTPDDEYINRYDRRALTEELARILS